jgi:hypothetical protein
MKKNNFLTYNQKHQHFNVGNGSFPLLLEYLNALDLSKYQHPPFESTKEGIGDVVKKAHSDFFGKTYAQIKLPYSEFKLLADEYMKVMKLSGELNYIPVVIKSNDYKISITYE